MKRLRVARGLGGPFFRILLVCLMLLTMQDCNAVEIRRLSVPRWIHNGTEESVVLDCEYGYNENDLRLVVKWFFEDNTEPVYQWIPELNKKHISGVLKGRLDTDFAVNTANAYSRFRALKILKPTTELSGRYTCLVTSLAGQDSKDQVMTVFVPAHEFDLRYMETSYKTVNVSCETQEVFPFPKMKLYLLNSSGSSTQAVTDVKTHTTNKSSGAFDVLLHRTFLLKELSSKSATVFECTLELQGTNYFQTKRIAYFPGIQGPRLETPYGLSSSNSRNETFIGKLIISYVINILFLHITFSKILIWNT